MGNSALIDRCNARASDLAAELELLEIELAVHEGQSDARWAAYEADKGEAGMFRWRLFRDRMDACRRNAKMTQEDIEHYRACALAIASLPNRGPQS